MATVKAFRGMRYHDTDTLKDLVTPPYDIISGKEQEAFYQKSPYNVIRLEYGKEESTDSATENKYTRAGKFLQSWLDNGILEIEEKPCFYVYEEVFSLPNGDKKAIRGLIARVKLQPFSDNVILPHEETLSKAKTDRYNLMCETDANFSQIYSLYADPKRIIPHLIDDSIADPIAEFPDEDGIVQRLWKIDDQKTIAAIKQEFADKQLFIADGHHRYETALRYMETKRTPGSEYVMMYLIDMDNDGLVVFPTHRMVKDVKEFDRQKLFAALEADFTITPTQTPKTAIADFQTPAFVYYGGKDECYTLVLKNPDVMKTIFPNNSEAYRSLDVNVLHKLILEKLGIDAENMALQKNLVYTRDSQEAIASVDSGAFQCAFLLNPTKVSQIKDVSLAGEKMPQKSTYFYPKLKTGLVMNKFSE